MKIISWIWFILIAFFLVMVASDGVIVGSLILLVASALSLPPLWEALRTRGHRTLAPLRVIVSVVLLPTGLGVAMANPSAETRARMDASESAGSHCVSWGGEHPRLVSFVTDGLRNPASFEHIDTEIAPRDARGMHAITMRYRAENGFGGMNVSQIKAKVDSSTCDFHLAID